jgi:small subunit ribosomal protein S8
MSVNDPIADFLTRIRNAHMAKHDTVEIPHSKMKAEIARILQEEGYVQEVSERGSGVERRLVITLSTSQGVLTDHQARRRGVGGEVLCFVY